MPQCRKLFQRAILARRIGDCSKSVFWRLSKGEPVFPCSQFMRARHLAHTAKRTARNKRSQPFATTDFQRDTALRKCFDHKREAVVRKEIINARIRSLFFGKCAYLIEGFLRAPKRKSSIHMLVPVIARLAMHDPTR